MHFLAKRPRNIDSAPSVHAVTPAECPASLGSWGLFWEPPVLDEVARLGILEQALGDQTTVMLTDPYNVTLSRIPLPQNSAVNDTTSSFRIDLSNEGPSFELSANGKITKIQTFDKNSEILLPSPQLEDHEPYLIWVDSVLDAVSLGLSKNP